MSDMDPSASEGILYSNIQYVLYIFPSQNIYSIALYVHAPHFRVFTTQFPNIQHPSFNPFLYFMRHKDARPISQHTSLP